MTNLLLTKKTIAKRKVMKEETEMMKNNGGGSHSHKVTTHTPLKGGCQMSLSKKIKIPRPSEIGRKTTQWPTSWDHTKIEERILNKDGTILDVN
jgi:hypothetical protein